MIDIPIELQLYILNHLDLKDILVCKQTCKHFSTLIEHDPPLRYLVQLGFNGLVDSNDLPLSKFNVLDRLRILNDYQDAWEHLRFTRHRAVKNEGEDLWSLQGNVISQITLDHSSIVFTQLPSEIRGVAHSAWQLTSESLLLSGLNIAGPIRFTADPIQDLLVTIKMEAALGDTSIAAIHLNSLRTGSIHPLASKARLSYRANLTIETANMYICSEHLALTISIRDLGRSQYKLCIWEWKTGELVLDLTEPVLAFSFLTEHHIMLIPPKRRSGAELLVFDLRSIPSPKTCLDELKICSFLFPSFKPDIRFDSADIQSNPICALTPASPFHQDPKHRISTINLYSAIKFKKQDSYMFVVPHETLMSHVSASSDIPERCHYVHWFLWGTQGSRGFRLPINHNSSFSGFRSSYGMRFVDISRPRPNQESIHIFFADFNQRPIRKALAFEGLWERELLDDRARKLRTVVDASVIEVSEKSPFSVQVTTSLPYRYGTIPLTPEDWARPWFVYAQMVEDGIVISRYSPDLADLNAAVSRGPEFEAWTI